MKTWKSLNFPYKLKTEKVGDRYATTLTKYLLDDLEGDVNLEDTPIKEYFTVIADSLSESSSLANIIIGQLVLD